MLLFFLDREVSSILSLEERAGSSSELRRGDCTGVPSAEGNCPVGSHHSPLPFAKRRDQVLVDLQGRTCSCRML